MEIKPGNEELNIIEEVIKNYKIRIENLKNEKVNKLKELENLLNVKKINVDKKLKIKIDLNKKRKNEELKLNYNIYKSDIEEIKRKYEKEIEDRENKYKKDVNNINNNYKLREEKEYIIHKLKMEELFKKYKDTINNLTYDERIEKMTNIKKINEVIYNTYNLYNNNYYNSININKILLSYLENEDIKNKIMKRILNNKYEEIIEIILQKRDEEKLRKEKLENEENLRKELEEIKKKISHRYFIFFHILYNLLEQIIYL